MRNWVERQLRNGVAVMSGSGGLGILVVTRAGGAIGNGGENGVPADIVLGAKVRLRRRHAVKRAGGGAVHGGGGLGVSARCSSRSGGGAL